MVIGELKIKRTRFVELGYANVGNHWRVVDIETGQVVGQQYRTQIELLADLERYAREYGCA